MSTFVNAVKNQEARTLNYMKARKSTANSCVDLFFKIGASRGKDIIPDFIAAYNDNPEYALRIALWARDIRGGAGERKIFRDILTYLETKSPANAIALLRKTPEIGRWDDLLVTRSLSVKEFAFSLIHQAFLEGNGLAAKWMPRKGALAAELRKYLGLTPKRYRKLLVKLTKVVETQMCAKDWDNINFSHVPSVAAARYKKAFNRHTPKYAEYVESLKRGDSDVKVNASAVFPYDVLKGHIYEGFSYIDDSSFFDATELGLMEKQWEMLPNYIGDSNILPLVDVSGSMTARVGGIRSKSNLTCLEVAVSLGLYCADKNKGKFKDTFCTFSTTPELLHLSGNILDKIRQMTKSEWQGSTDLHAALNIILSTATKANVPQEEMPDVLLILSDMQFNYCARFDDSAIEMIRRKYAKAGYEMPKVVFWNLNAYDNVPVKFDERGIALVSGFSPAIVRSILGGDPEKFTPEQIMLDTIMKPRYDLI